MDIIWSKEADEILSVGLPLMEFHITNWALNREEAKSAVEKFHKLKIPILGGNVLEIVKGRPKYNYDNWHSDPEQGETKNEFLIRSIEKSRMYLHLYKILEKGNPLFTLVPYIQESASTQFLK